MHTVLIMRDLFFLKKANEMSAMEEGGDAKMEKELKKKSEDPVSCGVRQTRPKTKYEDSMIWDHSFGPEFTGPSRRIVSRDGGLALWQAVNTQEVQRKMQMSCLYSHPISGGMW